MPQAETFYFISSAQYFYYHVLMAKAFVYGSNSLPLLYLSYIHAMISFSLEKSAE